LTPLVADFSGDDFHRQIGPGAWIEENHPLAAGVRVENRKLGDERRELRVVAPDRLHLAAAARNGATILEQNLGLIVHEDDVRPFVSDENRVGDVLEDEIETIALRRRLLFGLTHALDLTLELI